MKTDKTNHVYGEVKETGIVQKIDGIPCDIVKQHFPVDNSDGKWRWYEAYRFTAPGWDECTIVGLSAAKRVIRGRTDTAVLNTLGMNPYADSMNAQTKPLTPAHEGLGRVSVVDTIREYRDKPDQARTQPGSDNKRKSPEHDR